MNKERFKNNILLLFFVVFFCMGSGYSYLNSSLYINGTSIVNANLWNVGLDNLNISTGSVAAISEPIVDHSVASTSYSVKLAKDDDFFEFSVDVVNSGDYDAKLGSLVEIIGLTTEQEQYFNYNLTYQNNEPIEVNQLVKKDEFVRLKSRVEYKDNIVVSSIPESAKTLNLGFKLNYDIDDGTGIEIYNNGKDKIVYALGDVDDIGTVVTIGTEQFYVIGSDQYTVTLLAKYYLYVGNECNGSGLSLSCSPYGDETTGVQDENMGVVVDRLSGGSVFSNSEYQGNVYSDYNGSLVQHYVNNYKNILENNYDVIIDEARLITYAELTNENTFACNTYNGCSDKYPWIIYGDYWTMTPYDDDYVWALSDRLYYDTFLLLDVYAGVRPVIKISKNQIRYA